MCLNDIELGLGSCVAFFLERVAHSFDHMFFLLCPFLVLVVSDFESRNLVLIAPVHSHCLPFTFYESIWTECI